MVLKSRIYLLIPFLLLQTIATAQSPGTVPEILELVEQRMVEGQYLGVDTLLRTAIQVSKPRAESHPMEYAEVLSMQGWYFAAISDFTRAETAIKQALEIASAAPVSFEFGKVLHRAFMLEFSRQSYSAAENYCTQAIKIYKRYPRLSERKLLEARGNLAILYAQTAKIAQAQKEIIALLPIIEQKYGKEDSTYPILLSTLASLYAYQGNRTLAIELFNESLPIIVKLYGENHAAYFNAINNLAMVYMQEDRLEQAEELLLKSLSIRKKMFGQQSSDYMKGLNNLAVLYQRMGNYIGAAEMFMQSAEISEQLLGESSKSYLLAMANMANVCIKMELMDEARRAAEIVEGLMNRYKQTNRPEFIEIATLNNMTLASCGSSLHTTDQEFEKRAVKIKSNLSEGNTIYTDLINRVSISYFEKGDYETALKYADSYRKLVATTRGQETFAYLNAVINLGGLYYRFNRWSEAESSLAEGLDVATRLVEKNFPFMSEAQREGYWFSLRQLLFIIQDFADVAMASEYDDPAMRGLLYNYNLFINSMLLRYSVKLQKNIMESNDIELIAIWQELNTLKSRSDHNDVREEELDKQLTARSKPYRDYQNNSSLRWNDIRSSLSNSNAAIEIISMSADQPYYIAMIVRADYNAPKIVRLGLVSAVKEALKAQATKGAELYSLLFEPIEKYLENVKQLYIATEGSVSNVSFAGMKTNEGYLIDKYSICNVLSTKEICNSDGMKVVFSDKNKTAVLFGGADYSLLAEELATPENPLYALRGQGFDYLPGSKREVLNIADILSDKGWKHSIYTDEKATKVQFEMLSGRSPDMIHVSTHGYYFPPYERADGGIESDNSFKQSNDPMVRSGLLFSGANRAWGPFSKEDIMTDNGVLTGYDISLMDLTGTELVVLSACNTALGDMDYSEGVYGLQRAFRIAGVGTLLLSLWEIPDSETTLFMTEFYRQIITAASVRQAFNHTMTKMRTKYPENPKVWAGFVLIE